MKTKQPTSLSGVMTQMVRFAVSDSWLVWGVYLMFVSQLAYGIYAQNQFQGMFSLAAIFGILMGRISAIPDAQMED